MNALFLAYQTSLARDQSALRRVGDTGRCVPRDRDALDRDDDKENAMLTADATTIAAQAFANRKKAASVMMNCPSTDRDPPKYSATIAPMSDRVALTLKAVKMYGSAFGTRTLAKIAISLAAYERMSSSDAGSTRVRPRSVLIMIGKNTRIATTIIFESGFRIPNQLFMIGAKAMIGTGVRGDRERKQRAARRGPPRDRERDDERGHTADDESADRLDEGVASDRLELVEMLGERRGDRARGAGGTAGWRARARRVPQREYAEEHGDGRDVVADPLRQLAATSAAPGRVTSRPRNRSRTRVMKPK